MDRIEFLGCRVDNVDMGGAIRKVREFICSGKPHSIVALNTFKINLCNTDSRFRNIIRSANLAIADGISIVYGARLLGFKLKELVPGVDLMFECIRLAEKEGYSIYFLGSEPHVLQKVIERCHAEYPNLRIAGYHHGYYKHEDEDKIVAKIRKANPDILFVAFGSPRKEEFIHDRLQELNAKVAMGVGGSFEVFAGLRYRGPKWRQKLGLEWLNRLIQDPRRLARRYFYANKTFLSLLVKEFFKRAFRSSLRM